MPNLIMQDVPGTGTYSTTTPLEFPPGGGTGIGDTSGVSSAALREGNFLGNYLLWTGVFLSGIGSLYFVGKDKMLSLLLRDHYWAYHPTALRTKLQGLGVRFFSLKKTKTYSFQNNLPSLPVPDLEKTLQTYLNSVKPFLTEEEFCRTQSVVEEFKKGVGPELHKELVARAKTLRNWLESWWNEESYLSNRRSLAISSNWYGVGSTPDMIDYPDPQIGRASQTIKAMLQFKRMIDAETYEPWKVADTFPICMEQYKRLYGTCRIPGSPQDTIEVHPDSKHIIVFVKNWAYPLDLYNSKGEEITLEELDARLSAIRENAERRKEAPDEVSYLTSQDRDSWALDRQALLSDKDNAWSLKLIEEALFIVCLEDAAPENLEEHARAAFLGLDNRWYDAGMQMIIFRNGLVGSNMEHTGADATIPASMLKYVLDNEKDFGVRQDRVIPEKPLPPIPLRWDLPPDISSKIQAAKQAVKREMEDYDLRVLEFNSYGKSLIKTNHFSPDGFVQMALQLAYFKLNNSLALTYETAGTRLFYHGRTETIRSVSEASTAFVKAMVSGEDDNEKKRKLLEEAIQSQSEYTKNAFLGRGVDRHLLGLKLLAQKKGLKLEIFEGKAYNIPWTLSTSQTPCPNFPGGGFSPNESNGYGVAYVVNPNQLFFHITSKHSSGLSSSEAFMEALRQSLEEMKGLFSPPA